jgi:protein TonB
MALRFAIAVGFGLLTTFGLFWVMQALIGVGGELKEGRASPKLEFVRLKRDSTPQTKEREAPKRQKPEQPPPPPEMTLAQNLDPGGSVGEMIPLADTGAELAAAVAVGAGAGSERDVVPLVRVDPDYPPRARQRGIEGHVDLEFTIGPTGAVQNPKVIGAVPPDIFNEAALRAVRRWRYNPRLEDGVAVSRAGIKVRLQFELGG